MSRYVSKMLSALKILRWQSFRDWETEALGRCRCRARYLVKVVSVWYSKSFKIKDFKDFKIFKEVVFMWFMRHFARLSRPQTPFAPILFSRCHHRAIYIEQFSCKWGANVINPYPKGKSMDGVCIYLPVGRAERVRQQKQTRTNKKASFQQMLVLSNWIYPHSMYEAGNGFQQTFDPSTFQIFQHSALRSLRLFVVTMVSSAFTALKGAVQSEIIVCQGWYMFSAVPDQCADWCKGQWSKTKDPLSRRRRGAMWSRGRGWSVPGPRGVSKML